VVIDQGVEQELFAHVLEEVLLPPALEHPVSHFDRAQIPSTGDHRSLVSTLGQARHLAQPQLSLQEADRLVVQSVFDLATVKLGRVHDKARLSDAAGLAFAVGQDVEVGQQLGEELGAPAAAVEHHGDAAAADELACLAEDGGEHLDHASVGRSGEHEEGVASLVVDPEVRGGCGASG